ncbi:DUF3143 domain-containing protein [Cyanobium sp. WAJ14-Wanaka]|uniref:DUF3143 domain-containing protein n=1 Tax=Cyanobium sp. WAJ14-Wanaka TaxID=2823725 RepID=UPI0020CBA818|nr:DUF3143 domain-containing protein [Cyanobium sp. WAJ14-Wanaka]MCP9775248.1 DUF3143 domain-containing protein [Cyanobium sp. WAJ14-Wanaka]
MEDSRPLVQLADIPRGDTPLYHHPLPSLEAWLREMGAKQQPGNRCIWDLHCPQWSAQIELEVDELKVSWHQEAQVCVRHFPYGLSRHDAEQAILAGP